MNFSKGNRIRVMAAFVSAALSTHAAERLVWSEGHGDLAVNFRESDWQWTAEDGKEVDRVIIRLNDIGRTQVPDISAFSFLGPAGDPVWIIPAGQSMGLPFLGINAAATPRGTFANDRFDLLLNSVNGPGDFMMWTTSGTGALTILMNSRDGITNADKAEVPAGGHFHQNWGFTSQGTYRVGYRASGLLAGQTTPITSDEQKYTFEVNVVKKGEADIEVAYEGGHLEFHIHDEVTDVEFDPAHVALQAGPATWRTVPDGAAFAFLGQPGARLYLLPQEETEGMLFLGLAAGEVEQGTFTNDNLSIHLLKVDGPGSLFYYEVDGFGAPTVFFNSANGIGGDDVVAVAAGSHAHRNWGFTEPGVYRITLQARGSLTSRDNVSSEPTTFLFEVLPPAFLDKGEIDLEIAFEDGALDLALHEDATGAERSADETVLVARPSSQSAVPSGTQFSFLGAPGNKVYILPQEEREDLLFLGLAADEIPAGLFAGDSVKVQLTSVEGPGQLALYTVDTFGAPTVFWNSANGLDSSDIFSAAVGSHTHANWAFTTPGVYRVGLKAMGTLVADNQSVESEEVTLTFSIEDSAPILTAQLVNEGKQLQIGWPSRAGVSYQLQSRTTLGIGAWSNEGSSVAGNDGLQTTIVNRGNETLKVFQILELQP